MHYRTFVWSKSDIKDIKYFCNKLNIGQGQFVRFAVAHAVRHGLPETNDVIRLGQPEHATAAEAAKDRGTISLSWPGEVNQTIYKMAQRRADESGIKTSSFIRRATKAAISSLLNKEPSLLRRSFQIAAKLNDQPALSMLSENNLTELEEIIKEERKSRKQATHKRRFELA